MDESMNEIMHEMMWELDLEDDEMEAAQLQGYNTSSNGDGMRFLLSLIKLNYKNPFTFLWSLLVSTCALIITIIIGIFMLILVILLGGVACSLFAIILGVMLMLTFTPWHPDFYVLFIICCVIFTIFVIGAIAKSVK